MDNSLKEKYFTLNKSFKKKLVFHLGLDAGFFSEYNNMILAMLYCLENKIQFLLYSKDANFGYEKGWEDYFDPFCENQESYYIPFFKGTNDSFHHKYNVRNYPEDPVRFMLKDRYRIKFYKMFNNIALLTQDIWMPMRNRTLEKKHYYIPELGIDGDIRTACAVLIKITWNYNKETGRIIDTLKEQININNKYIGFHIRQGDKVVEADLINPISYIKKAEKITDTKNAFILTDDYGAIDLVKKEFPQWEISTLCPETDRGYIFNKFLSQSIDDQKKSYYRLFASVDILSESEFFIGTFSSNPGMYLGMRMPENKTYDVGPNQWQIW